MERAEAVIAGKAKALRKELAEKRRAERKYDEAFGTSGAASERGLAAGSPLVGAAAQAPAGQPFPYGQPAGSPPYDRSQVPAGAQAYPDAWFWTPAQQQTPASQPPQDGGEPAYAENAMPTGEHVAQHEARVGDIQALEAQLQVLEELRATLHQQQSKNRAHVAAIRGRDERSSKQRPWLTVITSVAYLILGWLLSMLDSPAAVLHALAR
jgi:ElaB/YqjD/DUF883 family membrane-anchored ribosome-binding protein